MPARHWEPLVSTVSERANRRQRAQQFPATELTLTCLPSLLARSLSSPAFASVRTAASAWPPTITGPLSRWLLASAFGAAAAATARADCIDDAAARHGVNALVLRAIGWHESRLRPDALARNANGTWDIGAFQINSIHLARLAAAGIDLHALRDGCTSADVAASHYAEQVRRDGNTWQAVGAYHSRTPSRAAWYANAIAEQLMRWRVLPRAPLPFDPAFTRPPHPPAPTRAGAASAPALDIVPLAVFDAAPDGGQADSDD